MALNEPWKITAHRVNNRGQIEFFHSYSRWNPTEQDWTRVENELWFKLYLPNDTIALHEGPTTKFIYYGEHKCTERELLRYLRESKLGKCISKKEYPIYDNSPKGNPYLVGYETEEVWEIKV